MGWLGIIPQRERPLAQFPVRAHVRVADLVPGWGAHKGNQWMFLSHIDLNALFLPPFPSL